MSIVIIIGHNKISCVELDVKSKAINIIDSAARKVENLTELLGSVDGIKNLLASCFGNNLKAAAEHKFYFAFAAGSGLAYKTWQSSASSFSDISDKTVEDKEERVLSLCMENIPEGLNELYKECTTSVVSCYEDEELYTVTSAYVPALYINNLKEACDSLGLTVFGISDIASSFYKLIDCDNSQILAQTDGLTVAVNQFGTLVLSLPNGYSESIADIIFGMIEKYYPLKNCKQNSTLVRSSDLEPFLKISIEGLTRSNCEAAVIAAGCVADGKQLFSKGKAKETAIPIEDSADNIKNLGKGGSKESVICKLRKLFKKK